jgi:hypothetical protein
VSCVETLATQAWRSSQLVASTYEFFREYFLGNQDAVSTSRKSHDPIVQPAQSGKPRASPASTRWRHAGLAPG